jgi:hypothetical protein
MSMKAFMDREFKTSTLTASLNPTPIKAAPPDQAASPKFSIAS